MRYMLDTAMRVARSRAVRIGFVVIALAGAAWLVLANRVEIAAALARLHPAHILLAALAGALFVWCGFLSWRRVLADLGHRLNVREAAAFYGISQLGKYIPGGVWNIAAAATMAHRYRVTGTHAAAATTISIIVAATSALSAGIVGFLVAPAPLFSEWGWVMWCGVPFVALLAPPVMNRAIALVGRIVGRSPEALVSVRGLGISTLWALAQWIPAGVSVAALAIGLGAPATPTTVLQCIGGYALAWVAGLVVVVAPAGIGVREAVLALAFTSILSTAEAATVVLLSRVVLTGVDLLFGAWGTFASRHPRTATAG